MEVCSSPIRQDRDYSMMAALDIKRKAYRHPHVRARTVRVFGNERLNPMAVPMQIQSS